LPLLGIPVPPVEVIVGIVGLANIALRKISDTKIDGWVTPKGKKTDLTKMQF
jgi:hypothetical protein